MIKLKHLFFLIFLLKISLSFGQKKLDKLYKEHAYASVVTKYEKLVKKDSTDCELRHKLAVSYAHLNFHEEAFEQYNKIIKLGKSDIFDSYDWNEIGQLQLRLGNQKEAAAIFKHLDKNVLFFDGKQEANSKLKYEVINWGEMNTQFSEFSPFLLNNKIVFTSDRSFSLYGKSTDNERSYLSLFEMDFSLNQKTNSIKRFSGKINSGFENGTASFSSKGDLIFYTKSSTNVHGVHYSKIYSAILINNKWKYVHPISINSDSYSNGHPVFLDSLKMLIYASDIPGGYGGMDLYYSFLKEGLWSDPINFGPKVNTPFNELFPTVNNNT